MTPLWLYALTFVGAITLSLLLVPAVREYAQRKEITDQPGGHKSHSAPVPYLGGVAMVLAFSAAMFVGVVVRRSSQFDGREVRLTIGNLLAQGDGLVRELIVVLGLALIFSAMGLIDDLRGLSPWLRFAVGLGIAVTLVAYGIRLQSPLPDAADVLLSVVWILGITNAFNLLDNIDGLAAGTAAVAATTFFLIALFNDQDYSALLAIGLAGAMLGFLRSNFHPATIYMGDAGSLFIGFLMAYLGLKMRTTVTEIPQLFAPLMVLGVAVLDTTMVVVSRLRRGVSPFTGGQDHLSHRLRRLGLSVRRSVSTLLLASVALGGLAVALSDAPATVGYWLLAAAVLSGVMATVLLTTKVARVTATDTETSNISPLRREVG
ncbi:MAG: undecaprenyl/decaprenyl-phosphate alpha-N-acetylglucosaminyl 1-phosphate transferase [Acidimicrobiia bacterium]|nr:undecaprenyl/decaprenyl-phosphate alpha-N-acetylglucosaminyl 1-phosphate transferase [Acidimicrobiia bacterium]